jgi:hypothetical protein
MGFEIKWRQDLQNVTYAWRLCKDKIISIKGDDYYAYSWIMLPYLMHPNLLGSSLLRLGEGLLI